MSFDDGFNLPNIFTEGKTPNPPVKFKKKGRKGKGRSNGFDFGIKKNKGLDSIQNMQKDSVIESRGMGIDQPKKSLGIETFDQNLPQQPNPLKFQEHDRQEQNPFNIGIELDAGFKQPRVQPQQKRNPLNVGLQVGNLGIDTFDTKKSAFSGNIIDVGIGATPKPRSALAGASNLGGDFIARTRGRDRTGLQGGGEQDFLRVSGKAFAKVPSILGSGEPTVQGARARAKSQALARAGIVEGTPQLNILGGVQGLAGGIGRASAGFRRTEIIGGKKVLTSTGRIAKGIEEGRLTGRLVKKVKETEFNPFTIRNQRKTRKINERAGQQVDDLIDQDEDVQVDEEFERETIRKQRMRAEIQRRRLEDKGSSIAIPEFVGTVAVKETRKQREARLRSQIQTPRTRGGQRTPANITLFPSSATVSPISRKFDTDGDGDIENLRGVPKGVFGKPIRKPQPATRREEQGFLSNAELKQELSARDTLSKIFVRKSRPNITIGELNETDNPDNIELNEGETLDTVVSDSEFLSAGLNDQLPRSLQKDFNRKTARARKRE